MVLAPQRVAVITADIIGSSLYTAPDRRHADRILRAGFRDTVRRFPRAFYGTIAFRITAGDEFQCVVRDVANVVEILTYLRAVVASATLDPPLHFRAAIGVGSISVTRHSSSYEQDGTAFRRARKGLEELTTRRYPLRWTKLITGDRRNDLVADAVLSLADALFAQWTVAQWEAVRWTILALPRQKIAGRLRIAHQNVTKRLAAAGWPHLEPTFRLFADMLSAPRTLNRV